jgi:hypothetical protein
MHPNGWQCRRCSFWYPTDETGAFSADYNRTPGGQCRRDPPAIATKEQDAPRWPATRSEDWCGRFEVRVER